MGTERTSYQHCRYVMYINQSEVNIPKSIDRNDDESRKNFQFQSKKPILRPLSIAANVNEPHAEYVVPKKEWVENTRNQ